MYIENFSNGHGYAYAVPMETTAFTGNGLESAFCEMPEIVDDATTHGSVLIEGEPGAGKSHIIQELGGYCLANNVPFLQIAVHINAGTVTHASETVGLLQEFRNTASESPAVCLIDNVDFAGFRNANRKTGKAITYAEAVVPELIRTVQDPNITTFGTAHSPEWRDRRWRWPAESEPRVIPPARQFMEAFGSTRRFEGIMTLDVLERLLRQRDIEATKALKIALALGSMGAGKFVYARHIDPDVFMDDPSIACGMVDAGRDRRTGQASQLQAAAA